MTKIFISFSVICFCSMSYVLGQNAELRQHEDFSKISFKMLGNIYLTQGDEFKVELQGAKSVIKDVITQVKSAWLIISHKNESIKYFNPSDFDEIDVYITMKNLVEVYLGAGNITSTNTFKGEKMILKSGGSGKIKISVDLNQTELIVNGSGIIEIKGSSNDAMIEHTGSGSINGENFIVNKYLVNITGSGYCEIYAQDELKVTLGKYSDFNDSNFKGNPPHVTINRKE